MTKIRSKWVSGLLEFFGVTTGTTVLKITESGIEANITGNITGSHTGAELGSVSISKAVDYALADAEKANLTLLLTATAGLKTFTLGLTTGQVAFVHNAGATNAFTVKNIAGDTGTSLAAGKTLLFVAGTTADTNTVVALN